MHTDTLDSVAWWARSRGPMAHEWIEHYQQSLQARHRTALVEIVRGLQPSSVLEIGCHCGPNLIRLCETFPTLTAHGVDANPEAIRAGQQWIDTRGLTDRIELSVGTFPAVTAHIADRVVDVVVTCYALSFVSRADLLTALWEIGRLAAKAVVLMEPMGDRALQSRSLSGYSEWQHDYLQQLPWVQTLRDVTISRTDIVPPVDRLNAALVLTRCP